MSEIPTLDPATARARIVEAPDDEIARLLADAALGARIRETNQRVARRPRQRADDEAFVAAVLRLRRQGCSFMLIGVRLADDFGNDSNVDPVQAIAKRAERVWRRFRDT